jgi:hypothetical protein
MTTILPLMQDLGKGLIVPPLFMGKGFQCLGGHLKLMSKAVESRSKSILNSAHDLTVDMVLTIMISTSTTTTRLSNSVIPTERGGSQGHCIA